MTSVSRPGSTENRIINVELMMEWELTGETEVLGVNLPQYHFVMQYYNRKDCKCYTNIYIYLLIEFQIIRAWNLYFKSLKYSIAYTNSFLKCLHWVRLWM
jgi:hypothetical protein